ncbi:hypothetical protein [Halolamina sediminis]|jgi:hypothetical protein|nr:hypothetical protein [Halolamina sediminis]
MYALTVIAGYERHEKRVERYTYLPVFSAVVMGLGFVSEPF